MRHNMHRGFAGGPREHMLDAANKLHQAARNLGMARKLEVATNDCAPVLEKLRWAFQDLAGARASLYGYDVYRTHKDRERLDVKLRATESAAMRMWKYTFERCGIGALKERPNWLRRR